MNEWMNKIRTLGNYPEENIQHSEHGKSLKSRALSLFTNRRKNAELERVYTCCKVHTNKIPISKIFIQNTHHQLVLRLRMSGAIPPFCLYAFMSWTGMILPIDVLRSYPLGKFDRWQQKKSCRELLNNFNIAPLVEYSRYHNCRHYWKLRNKFRNTQTV